MAMFALSGISHGIQQKPIAPPYAIDEYQVDKFFRSWLNRHKQAQYLFAISQDSHNITVKCINENQFLGIIRIYQGNFSLEIHKKNGGWMTDQSALRPCPFMI
jgi:hypothetical protein